MKHTARLLRLPALALLLTGCLNTPQAHQLAAKQKRSFAPLAAPAAALTPRFATLKISTFRTLPPFDSRSFIVQRPGGEFVCDFYNTWIASPNDLIRAQAARYLEESRLFSAVYDASSGTRPPLSLEGVVDELYLDFTGEKPAAVVTLRLMLLDERSPTFAALFSAEKTGRAEFDPHAKTGAAQAFGNALTQALAALVQSLNSAALPQG